MLASCATAPVGPYQYTPDEGKIKGYQKAGKALKAPLNNLEITVEPLTTEGLIKVLNPNEKISEVGYGESAADKIKSTMVFYVTLDNKGKEQVVFTPTKTQLIYERKNWYQVSAIETRRALDYADFYVILSKNKEAKGRLEVLRDNIFHGAVLISPGQKKSGLVFFPWVENDEDIDNFQLLMPGLYVGIESLVFSFNFKVEPIPAKGASSNKPAK
jgi:hypothetical protein